MRKHHKILTPDHVSRAIAQRLRYKTWKDIACYFGVDLATIKRRCFAAIEDRPDLQRKFDQIGRSNIGRLSKARFNAIRQGQAPKLFKIAPSAETRDQELTGTPPMCRSALNKVETDGRGNIAKGDELRSPLGPIRIPDIRINSSHSTVQARAVA